MTNTIKFSKETIEILSSFASINPGLILYTGKTQKTVSVTKTQFANVVIEETLPKDFAIFNLPNFLSILKELPDAELNFSEEDNFVTITDSNSSFKFYGTDKDMIIHMEKDIPTPEAWEINFTLSQELFSKILKFSSIAFLPDISIYSADGKIKVKVFDMNSDNSSKNDKLEIVLGDNTSELDFNILFSPEALRLITGEYEVSIGKIVNQSGASRIISKFQNTKRELTYFVAPNIKSKY
jgi:hypothetical protein